MEPLHLDDACWVLLKSLADAPKTPQMLARIHNLPTAACWKRVRFLEGLGLIHVALTFLTREGEILYFYQRSNEAIAIDTGEEPRAHL